MPAEDILYWVGGLLLVRYVGLPWIRTALFGPPALSAGWAIAAKKLGLEPTFVRRGLKWAVAVRLPVTEMKNVELEVRTTGGSATMVGLNTFFRLNANLPSEAPKSSSELVVDARGVIAETLVIRGVSKFIAEDTRRERIAKGEESHELIELFDAVSIKGDEALVAALLDAETRTLLRVSVHELGFVIDRGFIHFSAQNLESNHLYLEQVVSRMKELVRALAISESEVLPRLVKIATWDRSPEVRAHALKVMAFSFPKERTRDAFEKARRDPSPVVRLQVIATVTSRIEEIENVLTDVKVTPATMKEALRVAVRRFQRKEVEASLVELFRAHKQRAVPLRLALIEALGRLKARAIAGELLPLLIDRDAETREAVTIALGRFGGTEHEPVLLPRLSDADSRVVTAAIRALAQCGTVASITPLRATYAKKQLIDQAIARIVNREGVPHAGTLSLVGEAGGEFAIAEAGAGALSDPPDDDFDLKTA